jgi:hypothetical protein
MVGLFCKALPCKHLHREGRVVAAEITAMQSAEHILIGRAADVPSILYHRLHVPHSLPTCFLTSIYTAMEPLVVSHILLPLVTTPGIARR